MEAPGERTLLGSLAISNYVLEVFICGFLVNVADSPDQGRPASGRQGLGDVALGVLLLENARRRDTVTQIYRG